MTVEELARATLAAVGTDAQSYLLACQWIAERYQQLLSRSRFKVQRKVAEVLVPAAYQAGTVTATQGSATVSAVGALFTEAMTGWFFRSGVVWHEVLAIPNAVTLTLATPFTDESVTGATYDLVNKKVLLAPAARWIGERMVQMRTAAPIRRFSHLELTMTDPARTDVGPDPLQWTEVGEDPTTGARQIEFYPYPDHDVLVGYVYWANPPLLVFTDDIPFHIDPFVLKEGALIDVYRYEMGNAARAGQVDQAAFWRNEARAQDTSWEKQIQEAIRADTGADDLVAILALGSSGNQTSTRGGV